MDLFRLIFTLILCVHFIISTRAHQEWMIGTRSRQYVKGVYIETNPGPGDSVKIINTTQGEQKTIEICDRNKNTIKELAPGKEFQVEAQHITLDGLVRYLIIRVP